MSKCIDMRSSLADPQLTYRDRLHLALFLVLAMVLVLITSCAVPYPREVPTKMTVPVVKITKYDGDGNKLGYCTAWKLDNERMGTAEHCCTYKDTGGDLVAELLDLGEVKNSPVLTMEGEFAIPGETATVMRTDAKNDICILKGKMRGPGLPLATRDPDVGERVFTVGYPRMTYLISEGIWSGRDPDNQAVASIAVWGGASGSPVLNPDGQVVGVLVAMWPNFDNCAFVAPLEALRLAAAFAR